MQKSVLSDAVIKPMGMIPEPSVMCVVDLQSGMHESASQEVELRGVPDEVLKALIAAMYGHALDFSKGMLLPLFEAADAYQVIHKRPCSNCNEVSVCACSALVICPMMQSTDSHTTQLVV